MLLVLGVALVLLGIPTLIFYLRQKQASLSQPSLYIMYELAAMIVFGIVLIIRVLSHG
jgi:hypothetical protein